MAPKPGHRNQTSRRGVAPPLPSKLGSRGVKRRSVIPSLALMLLCPLATSVVRSFMKLHEKRARLKPPGLPHLLLIHDIAFLQTIHAESRLPV